MDRRLKGITLTEALRAVADIAMPRTCVVCGRKLLMREEHICTECEIGLPMTYFAKQRDNPMAVAFNSMIQSEIDSAGENAAYEPFSYAGSLLFYSGNSPYKNIPRRLKYGRDFSGGSHFAAMLGRELASSPLFADVDAVVPVPLHRARRWRRGYNQAEVIARALAKELGVPVETSLLRRVRKTKTQTRLYRSQRYANVKSAFMADCRPLGACRHLLLTDDVFTTGATLCACERALRAALCERFGPENGRRIRISAATLSFVGRL